MNKMIASSTNSPSNHPSLNKVPLTKLFIDSQIHLPINEKHFQYSTSPTAQRKLCFDSIQNPTHQTQMKKFYPNNHRYYSLKFGQVKNNSMSNTNALRVICQES